MDEVVDILDKAGIPAGPIYNCQRVCEVKNIVDVREMLVKVPAPKNHPEAKELTVLGNPIKMEETPCQYTKAAPDLGEDNEAVFRDLGFTDEELAHYREIGVMN